MHTLSHWKILLSIAAFGCLVGHVVDAEAQPFVESRNAQTIAFSPDGKTVVTGISGMSSGTIPLRPHPSPRKCAELKWWQADSGEPGRRVETFGDLRRLAFSPNGAYLAVSRLFRTTEGIELNEVQLYDAASGKAQRVFQHTHAFAFSSDSQSIVVVSRRNCTRFNIKSEARAVTYRKLGGAFDVKFSADAKKLIGIVETEEGFSLRICDAASGEVVANSLPLDEPYYSFDTSPDGKLIATGHEGGNILIWELPELRPLTRLRSGNEQRQHVLFSPDGETLACGGQGKAEVVFFDLTSYREVRRMNYDRGDFPILMRREEKETRRPEVDPGRFAFSSDGEIFAAGCYGGILRSMKTGNEIRRLER